MKIYINTKSAVPVTHQIKNQVYFGIASGKLKPGDRLPTIHDLAERFSIHHNTAAWAYRDLEVTGFVYTQRGMGTFVSDQVRQRCQEICDKQLTQKWHEVVQEAKACCLSKREFKAAVDASYATDGPPYSDVPEEIFNLVQ